MSQMYDSGVHQQGIGARSRVLGYDIYSLKRHWHWDGDCSEGFP